MSLLVWLPLNGTLENQGIASITCNDTPTYKSSGKIGGKSLDLSKKVSFTSSKIENLKTFTIMFWAKVNSDNSLSGDWVDVIGFSNKNNGGTNGILRWETCYSSTNGTRNITAHDNTAYAIANLNGFLYGEKNTWAHFAITVGADVREYRDGVLKNTYTRNTGGFLTGTFWCGENNKINGEVNDLRVYDECLSAAEVREIAKGLVVHYKMDGPMGGSGINLLLGSDKIGSTGVYGWIKNDGHTNFSIEKLEDGIIHFKGIPPSNAPRRIPSITLNNAPACKLGATYTYQMELKCDKALTLRSGTPAHFWRGARNTDNINNTSCNGNLDGGTFVGIQNTSGTLAANTWAKIIIKITYPSSLSATGYDYPAFRPFVYGTVLTADCTTEVNVWMRNCKFEEGEVATIWTPAPQDFFIDTTKLQDSSGFNNNATLIGSPTISTDTKRYETCTYFTNTQYAMSNARVADFLPQDRLTINIWGKWTNFPNIISCTESGGWNFEISDGYIRFPVYITDIGYKIATMTSKTAAELNGQWHMITGVFDGSNVKIYLDGELEATTATGSTNGIKYANTLLGIACEVNTSTTPVSTGYTGNISDIRIYATALLDSDIKSLYNTGMKINNLGGIMTYEFSEDTNDSPKLLKNGVLKEKRLLEQTYLFNDKNGFSYSPTGNNNYTAGTPCITVDFTPFYQCGQSIQIKMEGDLNWSNITPSGSGTFAVNFQGANYKPTTETFVWEGATSIIKPISNADMKTLMTNNATGTYHFSANTTVTSSWLNTYSKASFSSRTDYATGTISVSNLKITLLQSNAKVNPEYVAGYTITET